MSRVFRISDIYRHVPSAVFRAAAIAMTIAVSWALGCSPALADSPGLTPPPDMQIIDQNGINLTTKAINVAGPSVSIGIAGQGGLTWNTDFNGTAIGWETPGWRVSLQFKADDTSSYVVTLFGQPESFVKSGSSFIATNGGTLVQDSGAGTYTYTRRDGTGVVFNNASFSCLIGSITWCTPAIASTVTYPSGEQLTLTYHVETGWYGLTSVRSNLGYQLKINYSSCSSSYCTLSSVIALNNTIEYCNPSSTSCSVSGTWPTLTYAAVSGTCPNCTFAITDANGQSWQAITSSTLSSGYVDGLAKVIKPSGRIWELKSHYPQFTIPSEWKFDDGTDPSHPWIYDFGTPDYYVEATVTDPLGHVRVVQSDPANGFPYSDTLDAGVGGHPLHTYYENDGVRITKVTLPEGNYTQWTYDSRGNVTQVNKVGSGVSDIIQTATYPSCDSSNFRYCNKPTTITDAGYGAAGTNITTYAYDANSGEVSTVTSPVVSNGQPITANTYGQVHAWYKNSPSGSFVDGGPVWKLSTTSRCLADAARWGTFTWGVGNWTATGTCASESQRNLTTYAYPTNGGSGTATNALALSVTTGSGDGVIAATTSTTYDADSNVASITNPRGATTVYFYDVARNQIGVIGPDPDGSGSLKNPAVKTLYDIDGRISKVEQGTTTSQSSMSSFVSLMQNTTDYATSFFAFKAKATHLIGGTAASVTQYSYDLAYNLTCTAAREDASKFGVLPAACTQSGGTNPDQIVHNTYDAANRLSNVQSGYGATPITVVTNTYTDNSKIATVTDGNGNKSQYTYDGHDRLTQLNFPAKTSPGMVSSTDYEQYTYDANGNQLTGRLRSSETVTNSYDALNRLTQKSWSGGSMTSVYYGYDLVGDLLYARYGSATGYGATFTYDALGRKTSETSSTSGYSRMVGSSYDAAGNRTRLTYPDGNYIQYTYDALNRMNQVQQNGATLMAEYSYDDLGRETGVSRGADPATTAMTYGSTTQDWSLAQGGSMNPAVTYAMTYTPAAQVNQRTITSSSSGYQYGVTASTTNYSSNGLNQYTSVSGAGPACSGGDNFCYDARGNLTSAGSRSFSYNLANQMVSGPSTTIAYDPLGRLQQVTASGTTQYLYDGGMLVAEYNGSGTMLRRYVPGQGVDETLVWYEGSDLSTPHWLHTDEQGSVIATTDSSGAATPYAYSVTGEPKGGWSASAPAFRYTGQVAIASAAIYYYKARMYDPALGRFLQTDPVGYQAGMNLYAYVGNDYTNATDSSGLLCDQADQNGCAGNAYGLSGGQIGRIIKFDPNNPENVLNEPDPNKKKQYVYIYIGYVPVVGRAAKHAFIIAQDSRTGQTVATRGGPNVGLNGSIIDSSHGPATIHGETATYGPGFADYGRMSQAQYVGVVDMSLSQIYQQMQSYSAEINQNGFPYLGIGSNSNTYASGFLHGIGLDPIPAAIVPGWNYRFMDDYISPF